MKKLKTIYSLSKLTASEWIRLKFFHIVIFFGLGFVGFSHLLSSLTFSVQERLLYDFGLGSLEIGLIMVASLIGSHIIQREIDRKTMFVILARPIPRGSVVLGAWGAIAILCTIFAVGFLASLMITTPGEIPYAGLLVSAFCSWQKALVITSFAIAFGLLVRPILALVASVAYWVLCYSILDIEFFAKKAENPALDSVLGLIKKVLPEFYSFNWKSYYYVQNIPNSSEIAWTTLHNLSWICIWLLIGTLVFRRKEIV
ncbi:MAG: ABC transporter permease [Pseudobdellovibrio sp.]